MMANTDVPSATSQLIRVPLGNWSRTEYLYIQLQSELLLAVACLPAAPFHIIDDVSQYIDYCWYFAEAPADNSPNEAGSGVVKCFKAFIDKRDELSGFVMWALGQTSLAAANNNNITRFRRVQVTPSMLQDYRQIRERMGLDTYLYDPNLWPELWTFLQHAARNQFPVLNGGATQAGPTQDVGNDGPVEVNMDSAFIAGSELANNMKTISDNDPADEQEMSDSEADVDEENGVEDVGEEAEDDEDAEDGENDKNSGAAQSANRPGLDEFALETGTVRCTELVKGTDQRCARRANNENEDRRSWKCHNHDPARKQTIHNDRMARNRAKKAAKNAG